MKIIRTPPLVVQPPPTFSIEGLTLAELKLIHRGVGNTNRDDDADAGVAIGAGYDIFVALGKFIEEL